MDIEELQQAGPMVESAWIDVIHKMDETYAHLLDYQVELEGKNKDLEAMRQFKDSVLESMTDILVVCDAKGEIIELNHAALNITGKDTPLLTGQKIWSLFVDEDSCRLKSAFEHGIKSPDNRKAIDASEFMVLATDGPAPFEIRLSPRLDTRGRVLGAVLLGRPVGELRRAYQKLNEAHQQLKSAQAQLIQSEKLASLGRLVAGVAHELNNPISFVYGNAHALKRYIGRFEEYFAQIRSGASHEELRALRTKLKLDSSMEQLSEAIYGALEGAERVRDIVDSLKSFASSGQQTNRPYDLVNVIETAILWVKKGIGREILVDYKGPQSLILEGSSGKVQQIVMNLVQNAVDAMEECPEPKIEITIEENDNGAIAVFKDYGTGLSDEIMPRLFEPFFTTKPPGKGMGLGLSICYSMIKEMGGLLKAENSISGGACFTMNLPKNPPSGRSE